MLDRNKRIKSRPERFQTSNDKFDILVTCEERVYDQVIEGISNLVMLQYNTYIIGNWI
jgi:RNA polymerase II subunit A C-terminal domain phosphatase SSU72